MANFLIIAASSSIGKATVSLLENAGHNIFTTARSNDKINPNLVLDSSDFEAVDTAFDLAKKHLGKIDGVVNFAGSLLLRAAHLTSQDQYNDVIQSSLTTAFATVRSAGKYIDKDASIILMSSAAASIGLVNHEAIAAAKAGVIGLMRSAAATYASRNLRFNAICPGLIATDLTQNIISNPSALQYSLNLHPLGRVGKCEDIARAVAFLLDPLNDWITGHALNIDGGLSTLKLNVK